MDEEEEFLRFSQINVSLVVFFFFLDFRRAIKSSGAKLEFIFRKTLYFNTREFLYWIYNPTYFIFLFKSIPSCVSKTTDTGASCHLNSQNGSSGSL